MTVVSTLGRGAASGGTADEDGVFLAVRLSVERRRDGALTPRG
jgi:hypothetical protein